MLRYRLWLAGFTRQKIKDFLRTMGWVAPLTVMIWIYAEREQTIESFPMPGDVAVQVISGESGRLVTVVGTAHPSVTLTLSGPQDGLEKVRDQLISGNPRGVTIEVPGYLGLGEHSLNVVDSIQNLSIFKQHGVTVLASQPAELAITIDALAEATVKVQPDAGSQAKLNDFSFDPPEVHVSGPQSLVSRLKDEHHLNVYADLSITDVLAQPGKHDLPDVPLKLEYPDGLSVSPGKVRASLDVRQSDVTYEISSVPIKVLGPPNLLKDYSADIDAPAIYNIDVSGPPDTIQKIKDDQLTLTAVLDVTGAEPDVATTRALDYRLFPADIHVSADSASKTVTFHLRKRDTAGG